MASRHMPRAQQMPRSRRILLKSRLCHVALHGCTASQRCPPPDTHFALCLWVLKASCLNLWTLAWLGFLGSRTLGGVCPITVGLLQCLTFEAWGGGSDLLRDSRAISQADPHSPTLRCLLLFLTAKPLVMRLLLGRGGESRGAQRPEGPGFLPLLWVRARKTRGGFLR